MRSMGSSARFLGHDGAFSGAGRAAVLAGAVVGAGVLGSGCATASVDGEGGPEADARSSIDARELADGSITPFPDAPSSIDARPPPPDAARADAAPCTRTWITLLSNGTFDIGPGGGWSESSASGLGLITNDLPMAARSGAYAAWLGGALNGNDTLRQGVTVPASATRLRLSGYRIIGTEETTAPEYDKLDLELRAPGAATVLETLAHFGDNNAAGAWTSFQVEATSAHAGEPVDLTVHATTDATLNTNFFIDSLVLEAFACPP